MSDDVTPEAPSRSWTLAVQRRLARGLPDEPFSELVGQMGSGLGGRVLVFDGGRLAGIVSPTAAARALAVADLRAAQR